jgi:UDP-glucose 4-epimerase
MNILVTGGAGFIGSHVVDAYIAQGNDVTVMDDLSTGRRANLNPHARFVECDIRDRESLESIFQGNHFDLINHHAAQTDVRRSVADPQYDASVNVHGLLNLMECAVRKGVPRLIFASTGGAIYGEQDRFPADENHATRPISPYGVSKLASERYLFYYHVAHGLDVVVLRYANVYGPRQNPHGEAGVVAIFTTKLLTKITPVINGDGLQTRDYVYVSDVARANVLALQCKGFEIFNVGTGIETDVNEIFRLIKKHVGGNIGAAHGPAKPGEQRRSVLDTGRIFRHLGWKPTMTLEDGIKATVESFQRAGSEVLGRA